VFYLCPKFGPQKGAIHPQSAVIASELCFIRTVAEDVLQLQYMSTVQRLYCTKIQI